MKATQRLGCGKSVMIGSKLTTGNWMVMLAVRYVSSQVAIVLLIRICNPSLPRARVSHRAVLSSPLQRKDPVVSKRKVILQGREIKIFASFQLLDCVREQKAIQNGEDKTSQPLLPVGELLIMFIVLEQKTTKQVT